MCFVCRMEVLNEKGRFGGRTLRQIAEAFARSPQRLKVQEYANRVSLQSLNYNSFSDLLFGLFQVSTTFFFPLYFVFVKNFAQRNYFTGVVAGGRSHPGKGSCSLLFLC